MSSQDGQLARGEARQKLAKCLGVENGIALNRRRALKARDGFLLARREAIEKAHRN